MTARLRRPDREQMPKAERGPRADDYEQRIRALEFVPYIGRFVCLIFTSAESVVAGDDAAGFFLVVPADLDELLLLEANASLYGAGSSATEIQIRNVTQANDMLTDPIVIDSGDLNSYTSATPPLIDETVAQLFTGDILVADVDAAGSGALGLDVILAIG